MRAELRPFASASDLAACTALLRQGSHTFHAASLMLPGAIRERATVLYAFCRLGDDAIDLHQDAADRLVALAQLRERLELIYAGRPLANAADRAFAGLVESVAIPRALPQALLEGFEWDANSRRYETLADVQGYAARVAGTVGAMTALIMGARDAPVFARATELGVAMQLTNIARDVGEDARAGRLYLPQSWLRQAGIDPETWMSEPTYNSAIGATVERLLQAADALYSQSGYGIAALPLGCRPGMHAARLMYAEIGHEVRRRKLDSVSARAAVSAARKALIIVNAFALAVMPDALVQQPVAPLPATRFLVEAATSPRSPGHRRNSWRPLVTIDSAIEAKVGTLVTLFSRLEMRDRALNLTHAQTTAALRSSV